MEDIITIEIFRKNKGIEEYLPLNFVVKGDIDTPLVTKEHLSFLSGEIYFKNDDDILFKSLNWESPMILTPSGVERYYTERATPLRIMYNMSDQLKVAIDNEDYEIASLVKKQIDDRMKSIPSFLVSKIKKENLLGELIS